MGYAEVVDVEGGTLEEYHRVNEIMARSGLPAGLIAVAAGATENGFSVVSIWESKAEFDAFATERLGPALAQAGTGGTATFLRRLEDAEVTRPEVARA